MAIALVTGQHAAADGSGASFGVAFPSNVTAGSLIVVASSVWGPGDATITDSQSNSYGRTDATDFSSSGGAQTQLHYSHDVTGGANTVTTVGSAPDRSLVIMEFSGDFTGGDPLGVVTGANGSSSPLSAGTLNPTGTHLYVAAFGKEGSGAGTAGSGWTKIPSEITSNTLAPLMAEWQESTGSKTADSTASSPNDWSGVGATFEETGSGAVVDQDGFAFGDDDGTESGHTLDTEDTNHSGDLGVKTLRLQLDATGDPATAAYKLKFQKNGTGGYSDVATVASSSLVPVSIDSSDTTQDGDNGTSATLAVQIPAYSDGDLVTINLNLWSNGSAKTVTWPSGLNSETLVSVTNTTGSGTSNTAYVAVAYFIGAGSSVGGNLNITASATTRWAGAMLLIPAGEFDPANPISSATGSDISESDDTTPDYIGFNANSDDGDGALVCLVAVDQDPITGTPSGWTALETLDQGRSSIQYAVRDANVTDSESILASGGWTISGDAWTTFAYIIRPAPASTNEVYISTSGNVAAGGEATTARLTAPSTKTTGDFDTGRRWDDENGTDSIDITEDNYTELEWILTTQSPAADTDFYDFRVFNVDAALDSYVTPRWTISSGGADTLEADSGSYTYTGTAVGLIAGRVLAADSGSYTYSGTDADLLRGFNLAADSGSYVYAGTDAALLANRLLAADSGSYTYTGTTIDLLLGSVLAADTGSYTYSGTSVDLIKGSRLAADSGSYTYTGTEADLLRSIILNADSGAYTYTGTVVDLTFASAGDFTLTAETGVYTYSGTSIALIADRVLTADSGAHTYTGTAVNLKQGFLLSADSGAYTYTGTNIDFKLTRVLQADSGIYNYIGTNVILSSTASTIWTVQGDTGANWSQQNDSVTTWNEQADNSTTWNIQ